tara:strand:+ start:548 stop:1018 length:471 start_codon:yes stop_codon:yes gene_type:complete
MKSLYVSICLLIPFFGLAQDNSHQLVSNSGGSFSNEDYHMDFSIGQIAIEQLGNGMIITQGFHQGDLSIVTDVEELDFITKIYPNPTQSFFTIEFDSPQNVTAFLSDQNGKLIFQKEIKNQSIQSFDVSDLAQGNYQFIIINKDQKKSSFILNKTR